MSPPDVLLMEGYILKGSVGYYYSSCERPVQATSRGHPEPAAKRPVPLLQSASVSEGM